MIPILFESNEISFNSNGLGRLRDCISCVVTEERNGIYECEFQYATNGYNFDKIECGRIIGVTHDEGGDIQPFEIIGYSRPIDEIVTFHAVHISYRQTAMTVQGSNINSLSEAFTMLSNTTPANDFSYWTDKTSTGFLACADGIPRSVRQVLGGIEGSVLDSYGGEFEWDKWQVKLWNNRGTEKDFTIRYGLNLTDYKEDMDYSDTYTSVIPYWMGQNKKGKDIIVTGDEVSCGYSSFNKAGRCIPLDLSDKFEDKPTKAQVEAEALNYMNDNQVYLPARTLSVDFVRLSDSAQYREFSALQKCKLCDTINVVFSRYNMSGKFKIVKTEYDVLRDRYNSLELGTLSVTLAESLGISQEPLNKLYNNFGLDDFVIENYTHSYSAISSGGNMQWSEVKQKTGYYPIGVVGFYSGSGNLLVRRAELSSATSGECNINMGARAEASVSAGTANLRVLWLKEG